MITVLFIDRYIVLKLMMINYFKLILAENSTQISFLLNWCNFES
jgi:hypothetical protein